jgi:hypothetical protein
MAFGASCTSRPDASVYIIAPTAQTDDLRALIHQSAAGLDALIEQQVDEARGK